MEEPLKYTKDTKYDSRRIIGTVFMDGDDSQPITGIIDYTFTEVGDVIFITEISFYCAYPRLARKIDHDDLVDQVRMEIEEMENNIQLETKTVTIL